MRHKSLHWLIRSSLGFILLACGTSVSTPHRSVSMADIPSLETMTLDQKVGQLFIHSGHAVFMNKGSSGYQKLLRQVRDNHVGGFLWFLSDVMETVHLTNQLQQAASIPLLVSADLEAGIGMRFENTTFWPWAMAVGATGDPTLAEREGHFVAREALELGINHIFAPVADVNNNPDNPVINTRSFGEDPQAVARFVSAFIRGVQAEGVLATAKHFPGHGDTHTDSHRSLPVLEVSRDRLDQIELVPFRAAIAAGVGSMMIAHLSLPSLDNTPAPPRLDRPHTNVYGTDAAEVTTGGTIPTSMSAAIITTLLRGELGFEGIVVTDAFDMGGITDHYDAGEAAIRALEAGADQIAKSEDTDMAINGVKAAVASGRLSEARIDQSVRRILAAKKRTKIPIPDPDRAFRNVDSPEARALAEEIATKALTLVREESGALPLSTGANVVEIVIGDFRETVAPLLDFDRSLKARLVRPPKRFVFDRFSTAENAQEAVQAAQGADVVILAFTVRVRSGEGRVAVPLVSRNMIAEIEKQNPRIIGISFGTPYLLREVPTLRTYVAAYGVQPVMQNAAARALFGETAVTGRLPVSIPGFYPLGHGLKKMAAEMR